MNGVGGVGYVLGQPLASSYGVRDGPREGGNAISQFGYRKNESSYHIQSLITSLELSPQHHI